MAVIAVSVEETDVWTSVYAPIFSHLAREREKKKKEGKEYI